MSTVSMKTISVRDLNMTGKAPSKSSGKETSNKKSEDPVGQAGDLESLRAQSIESEFC